MHMYSFASLIKWKLVPTFSDTANPDFHPDTQSFSTSNHTVHKFKGLLKELIRRVTPMGVKPTNQTINPLCQVPHIYKSMYNML